MRKYNFVAYLMLLVSLMGFLGFYIIPFFISLIYTFVDNPISFTFVGLNNFRELFNNKYFLMGLKNTGMFMAISIPLNMVLSLMIAMVIDKMNYFNRYFSLIFLIPLAIPSATTAFFWGKIFSVNGVLNRALSQYNVGPVDWLFSKHSMYVMVFIFLWKNIGYNMILFMSGLNNIPTSYYECADIEGANTFRKFREITLTYLLPTIFLVLVMTFINSFKIFKEIFILTGDNPHESVYVLQHFMNNMFMSLNYPKLASSISILVTVIVVFVGLVFSSENKISKNLSD